MIKCVFSPRRIGKSLMNRRAVIEECARVAEQAETGGAAVHWKDAMDYASKIADLASQAHNDFGEHAMVHVPSFAPAPPSVPASILIRRMK